MKLQPPLRQRIACRELGQEYDWKLQTFGFVYGQQPHCMTVGFEHFKLFIVVAGDFFAQMFQYALRREFAGKFSRGKQIAQLEEENRWLRDQLAKATHTEDKAKQGLKKFFTKK